MHTWSTDRDEANFFICRDAEHGSVFVAEYSPGVSRHWNEGKTGDKDAMGIVYPLDFLEIKMEKHNENSTCM